MCAETQPPTHTKQTADKARKETCTCKKAVLGANAKVKIKLPWEPKTTCNIWTSLESTRCIKAKKNLEGSIGPSRPSLIR